MKSHLVKVAALAAVVGLLSFVGAGPQAGPLRESLKPAPEFALPGLDGKTVRLSDYKGKVVIVDFWATWCPPCRAEIPGFVKMVSDYKGRVAILGISLDEGREKAVRPFYAQYRMNYPVAFGDAAVVEAYGGIRGIPTTFVITPDQKIAKKHVGYADEKFWRAEVEKLLPKGGLKVAPTTGRSSTSPARAQDRGGRRR